MSLVERVAKDLFLPLDCLHLERTPTYKERLELAQAVLEALGFVTCQTSGCDKGRWPTRFVTGEECVCHLGDGERSCKVHLDWVNHPDCRLGVVPSEAMIAILRDQEWTVQERDSNSNLIGSWRYVTDQEIVAALLEAFGGDE